MARIRYFRHPAALASCLLAVSALAAAGWAQGARRNARSLEVCGGREKCVGMNPLAANIKILIQRGARPHFSPSGDTIVFDRWDSQGSAVYLSDLAGRVTPYTGERFAGRNTGNAVFDPSGNYILFIAEEPHHFMRENRTLPAPGTGFFCNLWIGTRDGSRFTQLTHIPVKQSMRDGLVVGGAVNPHFSPDGRMVVWTERYAKGGHWGRWRVRAADFSIRGDVPSISNERTLIDPNPGNYATAMGFLGPGELLVAGNLDGQNEFGMDQYAVNLKTGARKNLTNTPDLWEEGSCITPREHKIIYMTNAMSTYKLDSTRDWRTQTVERDYFIMDSSGANKQRLTYFNDPKAPEYMGGRSIVAACDVSSDGLHLAGTFGVDESGGRRSRMALKIVLLTFAHPL